MADQNQTFHRDVKRALANFHDLPYLRQHPLTPWLPPHLAFRRDRGKALQQWLRDAIQYLKPAGTPSELEKEWRPYLILHYRFIEGLSRRQAMERLGISESEFHRQQRKALAAVADFLQQARAETQPPLVEAEPIPRIQSFIGRQEELAYYRRQLEAHHFALITGMPGVGKTALAAELATLWKAKGPVIWFRFYPGRNTDLEAVLEGLALSLAARGQEEYWRFLQVDRHREAPLSGETRIRYLISLLTKEPYTLCFDNCELVAGDAALQALFQDLIRSARAGRLWLLIMSRTTPAFATAQPVPPLNGLNPQDARRLLQTAGLPPLPEATFARLYHKTAGVPVFLRLFAALVHSQGLPGLDQDRGGERIKALVEHLVRQPDVRHYLLHEVYETLRPTEQRFLEIISAFRLAMDDEDEEVLRLLAAEGIGDVGRTLEGLVRRHLFTPDERGVDVYLHPLVREYCYRRLAGRPADRERVHGRLAAYYEERDDPLEAGYHYARAGEHRRAAGLLTENLQRLIDAGQGQAALKELERLASRMAGLPDVGLRYELTAARERLYDLLGQREKQHSALQSMLALAERLGDAGREAAAHNRWAWFHEVTGNYPAGIEAAQSGLAAARRAGDTQAEAESLIHCGRSLWRQGGYMAAREQLEKALGQAQVMGDRRIEAAALTTLGVLCWDSSDCGAAESYFQHSLAVRSMLGDQRGKALALNSLGGVYYGLGDYDAARSYYEQALAIWRAIGDVHNEGRALTNLGVLYSDLGEYQTARDCYEQALVIQRTIGYRRGQGVTLGNLGLLHCHRGDYGTAQDYCRRALDVARTIGDPWGSGYRLTYLGMALEGLGDLAAAREAYAEALVIRREIGQQSLVIDSLASLGRVALAEARIEEAKRYADECLAYIAAHGVVGIEYPIVVYHTCARVLEACGEPERARQTLKAGYELLMERAEKISDPALRRSFLENVPANRELREAWQELQPKTDTV